MPQHLANIAIRPFTVEDEAFAVDLGSRVFSAYARDPRHAIRWILTRRDTATLVAELDSLRVGFVVMQYEKLPRDFGPWVRPTAAHLDAIAVRPDLHGRGVGQRLLESAEAAARSRPALSISLATAEENTPARRLFTRAGFVQLARAEHYYAGGQTAILMHRSLID